MVTFGLAAALAMEVEARPFKERAEVI